MDSRDGKQIRLGRVLDPRTGRGLVVAASHGVLSGPPSGLRTRDEMVSTFERLDRADAIMITPGMLGVLRSAFAGRGRPGLVLHLDWKNHNRGLYTPGRDGRSEGVLAQLADLDAVAAAGVDAVMTYLYIGHKDTELERREIERNAKVARDCERLGIGLIIEPRSAMEGVQSDALSPSVMQTYSRISADLGADIVKLMWPGSVEGLREVASSTYVPLLLAGGPGGEDDEATVQLASDAMAAGASGVMFGRRVYRASDPAAVLTRLRDIVHHDPGLN